METFTLKADINDLTGQPSARATVAVIETRPGPVAEPGGATLVQQSTVPLTGGVLEVLLPQDATPSGYAFRVSLPQLGVWWELLPPENPDVTVWLSDYPAGVSAL